MKPLTITFVDNKFHLEGYPDAEKVVALAHPKAAWFTDLALHKNDLDFAADSLDGISRTSGELTFLQQVFWRSAIIHFMKCFDGSASRVPLDANTLYGAEAVALQEYDQFRKLRNKHFVHDENAWLQCHAAIVLNKKGADPEVADVGYLAFRIQTLILL